ncbi:protein DETOXIFICATION 46, chloroplastic-like isoform X2 [Benincasa hispida]|uniref:protein DETOXIFICATION 46, chloroplastic-like isoform X2 n=1 Tax=Benincasa hispida TaxID=102211 RepID=UPI0018FF2338|nr:protein DETOXIFICATION 46, chloroplastic-like isoform X2 [Benincasa hispida]XP_038902801.1 protein DETOXIFICATION 46, chloroplastic-like isoform X2 [Benincasa hispida]
MADLSLSLAPFSFTAPKRPFKILHSPSSSITVQIRNPKFLNTLSRSHPSFPFTPTIRFPSSSSPSSSPISRRFAVPHDDYEREVSSLEIENEIDNGVQGNEQLMGTGMEELGSQGLVNQMKEIVTFTGPAIGLWICGPLMSLIDTAVIGQGSAVELAALGPATVLCDYTSYVFMFLSIATSNMVATALAKQDKNEVQHHISVLLFVGLMSGFLMLLVTKLLGSVALTAFVGTKNADIIPAANTYMQIRGLAWPAILIGWVAQSASLGMKDSWGPLKALAVASIVNGIGDVVLCMFLGYGIAGAAWATMASQVIAAYMMIEQLNEKGYSGYSLSVPSPGEFVSILGLAAPVFITLMSKIVFYTLLIYHATSIGTYTMAAHQVMSQTFYMCSVLGEPLSQTAQSFMPGFIHGVNRSLDKARMLLKSLLIIGGIFGMVLGTIGTLVPWLFPNLFTPEVKIIQEMHKVLIPYFLALLIMPATLCLEGTLLAGRDLKFISFSMCGCLSFGALLLQARFFNALRRVLSPNGVLYSSDLSHYKVAQQKAA